MYKVILNIFLLLALVLFGFSCQEKDPSIAKIYVRDANNILTQDVEVIVKSKLETTPAFTQTAVTNQFGYAVFQLQEVFDQFSRNDRERVGDFEIFLPFGDTVEFVGSFFARPHITAVKTIYLLD